MSHIIRNLTTQSNDFNSFILGPVELVLDVPFYVGCFQEVQPFSGGTTITGAIDDMTPAVCILKCLGSDTTKRYAFLKNGNECFCFDNIPTKGLLLSNDVEEEDNCNIDCVGSDLYKCGGTTSVSVYVASKNELLL